MFSKKKKNMHVDLSKIFARMLKFDSKKLLCESKFIEFITK